MAQRYMIPWLYDLGIWIFTLCLDIFFREVYSRGAWRIPKRGPVIIVAAPHANQFVDSILLMRILKHHADRRTSFLIAEKSMREPYIGTMAGCMGALPVVRAMDNVKPGSGTIYLPDPEGDPTLLRGRDTDFTTDQFMEGGAIILPRVGKVSPEQQAIADILGPHELRLRKPFKEFPPDHPLYKGLREGTSFKVAPHIDQSKMFDAVYKELCAGGCIGIFPEGGSHDRPSLLPLKAGAAIIALGALAREPDCGLSIIPCGMNYFHPNKFRSRAVVEFGNPVQVHPDQIEAFKAGGNSKRNAVGSLLETIQEALTAVTQQAPDHETLALIQATRRLYKPLRMKLPLPLVIELNRRLLKGYTQFKDERKVVQLKKAVTDYNRRLRALGIRDHQVEWGDVQHRPWWLVFGTLLYRIGELLTVAVGTLPSVALFWPVFVTTKIISVKKQRKALAGSVVKLEGRDVVGTWKILVAMGLAPTLYTWYTAIGTIWLSYCRKGGHYATVVPWWINAVTYVPDWIPLSAFAVFFFGLMISVSFAGLRIGEIGIDVLKSLPPLLVALSPRSSNNLAQLRAQRQELSARVVDTIDTFAPEIFPDFEAEKLVPHGHPQDDGAYRSRLKSMPPSEPESRSRSRPGSGHSRSQSGTFRLQESLLKPLTIGSKEDLGEVNRRIRDSMQERGRARVKAEYDPDEDAVVVDGASSGGNTTDGEEKKTR
ncbi:glycerol-3-phosphate acyltransferase Sct1 [Aspergillus steynii IBT 23096]|uniref:Glycerol-3-phosphate acyltransferase Sct1 n=1 Tax=Aspergillus steynii IBT 23096 TaxID=1392250 RepID=A0A2I2GL11_9EURO|nr:glycerol-3-phosphate acyltransferase Sct1 [Aspergillus steynii IBT 23096]PLB53564.1 glycerol-3-phosphate acyltransferase Sct1 [Aspergillus steynii IBT 23096]